MKKEFKKRFVVTSDCIQFKIGKNEIKRTSKARKRKPRTSITYSHKLSRIKSFYNKFKEGSKFKQKYPDFEDFLQKFKFRQPESASRL